MRIHGLRSKIDRKLVHARVEELSLALWRRPWIRRQLKSLQSLIDARLHILSKNLVLEPLERKPQLVSPHTISLVLDENIHMLHVEIFLPATCTTPT